MTEACDVAAQSDDLPDSAPLHASMILTALEETSCGRARVEVINSLRAWPTSDATDDRTPDVTLELINCTSQTQRTATRRGAPADWPASTHRPTRTN